MERDIIESLAKNLPGQQPGINSVNCESWQTTDGDAEVIIHRHSVRSGDNNEVGLISVGLKGREIEWLRVISEFSNVFGEPHTKDDLPGGERVMKNASWLFENNQ